MFSVETRKKKDRQPENKEDRERDDVEIKQISTWNGEITNKEREPEGHEKYAYIPQQKREVFSLGNERHVVYYDIK